MRLSVELVGRREVDAVQEVREEDGVTIIPIVEEQIVVKTRLVLKEEIRITRTSRTELFREPVRLRSERAEVVRLEGPGGHTSRPHLSADVVFALAQVVTQVPAILSRRLDPRAGLAMVWGRIQAGGPATSPASSFSLATSCSRGFTPACTST